MSERRKLGTQNANAECRKREHVGRRPPFSRFCIRILHSEFPWPARRVRNPLHSTAATMNCSSAFDQVVKELVMKLLKDLQDEGVL